MSALRLSRPGEPTLLIDLGPSVGRRTPGWGGRTFSYGGTFVQGESDKARQRRVAAEWKKANPELARERQNAWYAANREKALESQRRRRSQYRNQYIAAPPIDERGRTVREYPRCGVVMRLLGEPCYRRPGHADSHRSQAVMERDAKRRSRP